MKTLFNKITKNIILPLAFIEGIYNAGFSQQISDSLGEFNTNMQAMDFNKDKKVDYLLFRHDLTNNGYAEIRLVDRDYDEIFESKTVSIFDKEGNIEELEIPLKYIINPFSVENWIKTISEIGIGEYNVNLKGGISQGFIKLK